MRLKAFLNFEQVLAIAVYPAAHKHAAVLGRVKAKPPPAVLRSLDPSCARQHWACAWPGRKNGSGRTKECRLGVVNAAGAAPVAASGQLFYAGASKVTRKGGRSGEPTY
jgi:hypothetical protein